jgi:hypothetical protein
MIVGGLVGEAATIIFVPPGSFEKSLSVAFTLIIAAGVWIEEVGGEASEAKSEHEIVELAARAAEANERGLQAQLALEQFKAPRTLDTGFDTPLVRGLKEFAGLRIDIVVNLVSPDAYSLGNSLKEAFRKAGWQTREWDAVGSFPIPGIAVGMAGWDADKPRPIWADSRDKIITLLNEAGLAASIGLPYSNDPRWSASSRPANLLNDAAWDVKDVAPIRIVVSPKP